MDSKDIVVLKFGGSSVADNLKLNVVAEKIIAFYKENFKIVVVVSAQGKTTDTLIKENYPICQKIEKWMFYYLLENKFLWQNFLFY